MTLYSINYIDYKSNEIISKNKLYDDINDAKYDINLILLDILDEDNESISSIIDNESLFIINPVNTINNNLYKKSFNIDNTTTILILKHNLIIDIFYDKLSKGYIYNNNKIIHMYKFFINSYDVFSNPEIDCKSTSSLDIPIRNSSIQNFISHGFF